MKLSFDALCQEIRTMVARESKADRLQGLNPPFYDYLDVSPWSYLGRPQYWVKVLVVISTAGWTEKEYFEAIARKDLYPFLCDKISDIIEHEPAISNYWPKVVALLASYNWTEEQYWEAVAEEQKKARDQRVKEHNVAEENRANHEHNMRSFAMIGVFFVIWMTGWAALFSFLF